MYKIVILQLTLLFSFLSYGQDSVTVLLKAHDLSEDLGVMSSLNDEILLLAYEKPDSGYLSKPILISKGVLDSSNNTLSCKMVNRKSTLIFFIIELDMDPYVEQIDPILRVYYKEIISAFNKDGDIVLEKYFHRKDLLGYVICQTKRKPVAFSITGRHKLDKYHYTLSIKPL